MADEGEKLTCTVTATNQDGPASARSSPVMVARCPPATGTLSGDQLGAVHLGMTRQQALRAYRKSSNRGRRYQDFFCLTPRGVRVGYASPKLLRTLSLADRDRFRGRVVWISTAARRYSIRGVRPGASLEAARRQLDLARVITIGLNDWYLAPAGPVTAVLKVRHGTVQEIGIAVVSLTGTRLQRALFMGSFWLF
jgi:hypothetical protein